MRVIFAKRKKIIFLFACVLLVSSALFADDLIIPVVNATSEISNAQWNGDGKTFSYQVNEKLYTRDTLTLILNDVRDVPKDTNDSTPPLASQNSSKIIHPNSTVNTTYRTKDGGEFKIESSKSINKYDTEGNKQKTFSTSSMIAGFSISDDEETLVIYDLNNALHFYNSKTGGYIGYTPKFGVKRINSAVLNDDSSKLLITTADNSLYIANTKDVLFSPETTAKAFKPFSIMYNAKNPDEKMDGGVTEFSVKEFIVPSADENTEFIESTKEKAKETQKFELAEETKNTTQEVVIVKQKDVEFYPSTIDDVDKEVIISQKEDLREGKIVEYKTDNQTKHTMTDTSVSKNVTSDTTMTDTSVSKNTQINTPVSVITTPPVSAISNTPVSVISTPNNTPVSVIEEVLTDSEMVISEPAKELTAKEKRALEKAQKKEAKQQEKLAKAQLKQQQKETKQNEIAPNTSDTTNNNENKNNEKTPTESPKVPDSTPDITPDSSPKSQDAAPAQEAKQEKPQKPEKPKKEKKQSPFQEKLEEEFDEEEIKGKFKDGQGIQLNLNYTTFPDPYVGSIGILMGYRNYDILKPFYFGGSVMPFIGLPKYNFPYKYTINYQSIGSPYFLGGRLVAPFGFAFFPLENSFEVYAEFDVYGSINTLWNKRFGSTALIIKPSFSFGGDIKIGVAWDFINLDIAGTYDSLLGLSFSADVGVILNLGGSRNVGGSRLK